MMRVRCLLGVLVLSMGLQAAAADWLRDLQSEAIEKKESKAAHWGPKPTKYSSWTTHSNRLIPVYTFGTLGKGEGIDLDSYTGERSVYRNPSALDRLYQGNMQDSVNPSADYMDQTNVFDLQLAALQEKKKHIILVVFDGMDWQTTQAASIAKLGRVAYTEGRGEGFHFQEYEADGTSQYGYHVPSPQRSKAQVDVDKQKVQPSGGLPGGYCPLIAGEFPWSCATDAGYLIADSGEGLVRHAYPDSASTATSMMCGVKTYNAAIGVGPLGELRPSIALRAQAEGYKVGVVTSVPICHATPGSAYAANVHRDDYQDISRDLLGLPSVSHPDTPLPGLDVVIGSGHGVEKDKDDAQGKNFKPGNKYLADQDLEKVSIDRGGKYLTSVRTPGVNGAKALAAAAERAAKENHRLLGYYGIGGDDSHAAGHLPFASADGDFKPAPGVDGKEFNYTEADLNENPTLEDMTKAALTVLSAGDKPFWMLLEAGDVDWANHNNNLDASAGAVISGDAAFKAVTDWVEEHSNWDETVVIVTADHGHYLVIDDPELLAGPKEVASKKDAKTTDKK
ncbi:alkaline phosphatase [Aeoliella sp. SH292]|uniref:alkaline phosphatase n=1 Tax=Aeoliella sp. SH292 TaxID=3454464 RepID=UPI003F9BD4F1